MPSANTNKGVRIFVAGMVWGVLLALIAAIAMEVISLTLPTKIAGKSAPNEQRKTRAKKIDLISSVPIPQEKIHSLMGKKYEMVNRELGADGNANGDKVTIDMRYLNDGRVEIVCTKFAAVMIEGRETEVAFLKFDDWHTFIGYSIVNRKLVK